MSQLHIMTGLFDLTPEQQRKLDEQIKLQEEARKKYRVKKWRTEKQMIADKKRRKAFAEHKLIFPSTTDAVNELHHTMSFGSVRSGVLQKLMFVNFMVCEYRSPLHYELAEIHNACNLSRARKPEALDGKELVHYLKPEHVMKLIGCNKRTAIEYVEVIQSFYSMPEVVGLEIQRKRMEDRGESYYDIYKTPSSLAEAYPAALQEEGKLNDKSPQPLPTCWYRVVMDKDNLGEDEDNEIKRAMDTAKQLGDNTPLITFSTDPMMIDRINAIKLGHWEKLAAMYLNEEQLHERWEKMRQQSEKEKEGSHKVI